ncbi:hypothetical protein ACTNBL_00100 [Enterococcus villorum]|uniref:Uncharacterized protein n=2 Tax=Enterococcus villorum TaxID=112904 RepID=A0A511J1P3_9ENTE|nr:hypothetical protein [Enterococcus villorum]EOH91600.1 hypothetical protein UAO_00933 [Enterococcus villorum ATCC 700913]EOW76978.1 hypothetical protein I591_02286 [Enterococcus villorum ATCC 700913]GEL91902.1 hypothetical protein EVI01_12390 [Enterococcus villorum]
MNKVNMNKKFVIISIVVLAIIGVIFSRMTGSSGLEKPSEPLVTQILQEQYNLNRSCDDVTITHDNGDNTYRAKATLDNGSAININIEYYPKKDRVYVEIPYTEVLMLN